MSLCQRFVFVNFGELLLMLMEGRKATYKSHLFLDNVCQCHKDLRLWKRGETVFAILIKIEWNEKEDVGGLNGKIEKMENSKEGCDVWKAHTSLKAISHFIHSNKLQILLGLWWSKICLEQTKMNDKMENHKENR